MRVPACLHLVKNWSAQPQGVLVLQEMGTRDIGLTILTDAAWCLNQAAGFQIVKFSMKRTDFHGTLSLPTEKHYVYLQPSVFS